jgi:hypothetical protein
MTRLYMPIPYLYPRRKAFRRMDTFKRVTDCVCQDAKDTNGESGMRSIYILTSGGRRYAFPPYAKLHLQGFFGFKPRAVRRNA